MCVDDSIPAAGLKAVKSQISSWFTFVRFFRYIRNIKQPKRHRKGLKSEEMK